MTTAGPVTVKHVEENGAERITQAIGTQYYPGGPGELCQLVAFGVPNPESLNDHSISFQDGTIYVMNEAGATVARYHLNNARAGSSRL